jgi:hypothetical protein
MQHTEGVSVAVRNEIRWIDEDLSTSHLWGDLLVADVVESAVQLVEFSDDATVGNPIPAGRRVRDLLDEFDFEQEVRVVTDGLARDASVLREFGFVEFAVRRQVEQRVYQDRDAY